MYVNVFGHGVSSISKNLLRLPRATEKQTGRYPDRQTSSQPGTQPAVHASRHAAMQSLRYQKLFFVCGAPFTHRLYIMDSIY